jgi:hypothetical protein
MRFDTANRDRFVPRPAIIFNNKEQDKIIGEALKDTIGMSYIDALSVIASVINNSAPDPNGFPILFIHKEQVIKICADNLELRVEDVARVIEGFSISKDQIESEGRELWKPKQEYRAYRRGFFEFPHPTGAHLAFSREMAQESFLMLLKSAVFHQLPKEWISDSVKIALSHLSNEAGAWFERVVEDNLRTINIVGVRSAKNGIGVGTNRIAIPPDIGEIDFIGYSEVERLLVIVECKLSRDSSEPKLFRDDLSDFVQSKNSYIKKFRKKFEWVKANLEPICRALESTQGRGAVIAPVRVAGAIITFLPSIAACFIDDYPCVSLTELMLNFESFGGWPYQIGVRGV